MQIWSSKFTTYLHLSQTLVNPFFRPVEDGFQLSVVELFKTSKVLTWPRNVLVSSQILPLAPRWSARTILKPNQVAPGDGEELPWRNKLYWLIDLGVERRAIKCWLRVKMAGRGRGGGLWKRTWKERIGVVEEDAEQNPGGMLDRN